MHNDVGAIMSKWDEQVVANEDDLRRVGVLVGDFYCQQRMNSLLGGGVWKVHTRQSELEEKVQAMELALLEATETIKRLEMN